MPTYDYECDGCGHEFELFQPITDSPRRKCPKCSALKLRRLFGTGAAIVFKGSGFYQTDYRSESYKRGAAKAKKAKEGAKKAKEGSSDTKGADTKSAAKKNKPAAKTES